MRGQQDRVYPEREFLERLIEQRAFVADDLVAIDPGIWAVHGVIPAGEHVILAEFDRPEEARAVLDSLTPNPIPSRAELAG